MKLSKVDVVKYIGLINLEFNQNLSQRKIEDKTELWFASLNAFEKELVDKAFQNVMQTSEYPPRLATICNEIKRLTAAVGKSDEELWQELKAVLYPVYHNATAYRFTMREANGKTQGENAIEANKAIYEGLSPELKNYLRTLSELITIANMTSDELQFEKIRFMKRIPAIRETARTLKAMPTELIILLQGTSEKKLLNLGDKNE